jgi:hypothetical protein
VTVARGSGFRGKGLTTLGGDGAGGEGVGDLTGCGGGSSGRERVWPNAISLEKLKNTNRSESDSKHRLMERIYFPFSTMPELAGASFAQRNPIKL